MNEQSLNNAVSPDRLLETIGGEYVESFIKDGGSVAKVYVGEREARELLAAGLKTLATRNGFAYAFIDSRETKIHLTDRIFHSIACQIDWLATAARFLTNNLAANGISARSSESLSYRDLANASELDEVEIRTTCLRILSNNIHKDYTLYRDFRLALSTLCRSLLEPDLEYQELAGHVVDWLRGNLASLTTLRRALIYKNVNRHSARHMISSTAFWLRKCEYSGVVIVIDFSRLALWKRAADGSLNYTPSAAMEGYEVLRQFIDSSPELAGVFVAFLSGGEFLFDQQRGLNSYEALRLRLADTVRDSVVVNPLAPMVRIQRNDV